jgi:hypothetical protein
MRRTMFSSTFGIAPPGADEGERGDSEDRPMYAAAQSW